MRKLLITAGAVLAWLLLGHFGLLAVLVYVWATAMTSTANTAKARTTEQRVNGLVGSVGAANTRVNNLSGQNTSNNGLANGTINGHTDTAGLADGTIGGTSGGQIGGAAAHTHGPGSYSVNNGHHDHGGSTTDGTLAVANGVHDHSLPSV